MSYPAKVRGSRGSYPRTGRQRWSDALSAECVTFTTEDWDSGSLAFTLTTGSNVTGPTASSDRHALFPACYCPVGLSAAGKLVAQAPPSSASRLHRGCNDAPHGAHATSQFPSIALKHDQRPLQDATIQGVLLGHSIVLQHRLESIPRGITCQSLHLST